MRGSVKQLKVLVASPSDTLEERKAIPEVIDRINKDHGENEGYVLSPVMWESDASPGVGYDAQDVINQQLQDYDIFVGLMSARFGSPTRVANSGTEEEFGNAFERFLTDPSSIRILFYFREAEVNVHDQAALLQALHICRFRAQLQQLGVLYQQYKDPADLSHQLRTHLPQRVRELLDDKSPPRLVRRSPASKAAIQVVSRGEWVATATKRFPQGANYLDLVLATYAGHATANNTVIHGSFESQSPYFRFGFKLLALTAKPFGEGSILTYGPNLVVHISKDHNSNRLFLASYHNGVSQEPLRTDLFDYAGDREIDLALAVGRDGSVYLKIDGKDVGEWYVQPVIKERVLLLGWADHSPFEIHFRDVCIEFA